MAHKIKNILFVCVVVVGWGSGGGGGGGGGGRGDSLISNCVWGVGRGRGR